MNQGRDGAGKNKWIYLIVAGLILLTAVVSYNLGRGGFTAAGTDVSGQAQVPAAAAVQSGEPRYVDEIPGYGEDSGSRERIIYSDQKTERIVEIAADMKNSVVSVTGSMVVRDMFNNEYEQSGEGSGVIFKVNGDAVKIITNYHVIDDAEGLSVDFAQEIQSPAELAGYDADSDLAVIEVRREDIPADIYEDLEPVVFGDSDELRVGETAIAIGNPLGYDQTVTVGVISGLNRELMLPDRKLRLIQTDAAINPGNSGGALVNINGEVIGINTAKIAETTVEGIGFAIPSNYFLPLVSELDSKGFVARPYLGIVGRTIDQELSGYYGLPLGAVVLEVEKGSAAEASGLMPGDVITRAAGRPVLTMEQLSDIISGSNVGDELKITVVREGNILELTAVLRQK